MTIELRGKENFVYDAERDEYICPEDERLKYNKTKKKDVPENTAWFRIKYA